jgi:hypothetical protein
VDSTRIGVNIYAGILPALCCTANVRLSYNEISIVSEYVKCALRRRIPKVLHRSRNNLVCRSLVSANISGKSSTSGLSAMFYIGAFGLVFGAIQSRRLNLGLLILLSAVAAVWIYLLNEVEGFSLLHSAREGVYAAWSVESGALAGLFLDRLVWRLDR